MSERRMYSAVDSARSYTAFRRVAYFFREVSCCSTFFSSLPSDDARSRLVLVAVNWVSELVCRSNFTIYIFGWYHGLSPRRQLLCRAGFSLSELRAMNPAWRVNCGEVVLREQHPWASGLRPATPASIHHGISSQH